MRVTLQHPAAWNGTRRERASWYQDFLAVAGKGIKLSFVPSWSKAVFHPYVIQVQKGEQLLKRLGGVGIGMGIHYAIPLHLQNANKDLGYREGDFPMCEKAVLQILSLPVYPGLTFPEQSRTAEQVLALLMRRATRGFLTRLAW